MIGERDNIPNQDYIISPDISNLHIARLAAYYDESSMNISTTYYESSNKLNN